MSGTYGQGVLSPRRSLFRRAEPISPEKREGQESNLTELHKYLSEFKDIEIRASDIGEDELALVLFRAPILLKALISTCNIAQRAIKRDLGFDVKTYGTKLKMDRATQLAKYIKPFLPKTITLESLLNALIRKGMLSRAEADQVVNAAKVPERA